MVPRRIALTALALGAPLLLCAACERTQEDWVHDLTSRDPWRREMAALALRSVDDEEVERTVRSLLQKLADREPRVTQAIAASLECLAPRAVEPMARALELLPPERVQPRELLVRLLSSRARAGDERARAALVEHAEREIGSGDPERGRAAQALLLELAR